ncbi:hypothetical protein P9112_009794 [Eukaryota sp. TZLM1-RC]
MTTSYHQFAAELPKVPCTIISLRDHSPDYITEVFSALRSSLTYAFVAVDTEWKPIFQKLKEPDNSLDLLQFSSTTMVVLVQVHQQTTLPQSISSLLLDNEIVKVFKGISEDKKRFSKYFGIDVTPVDDTDIMFRQLGMRSNPGVLVQNVSHPHCVFNALNLTCIHPKDKKISRSNWRNECLTDKQILYASLDVYYIAIAYEQFKSGQVAQYLTGNWLNKQKPKTSTTITCSLLGTKTFTSLFKLSEHLSKLFNAHVYGIYDFCSNCSFSAGLFDSLDQCCDLPDISFKAVCRGCFETFLFPSELPSHLNCFSVNNQYTAKTKVCTCQEAIQKSFTDLFLHAVASPDQHPDQYSAIMERSILNEESIIPLIDELFHNAKINPVTAMFKEIKEVLNDLEKDALVQREVQPFVVDALGLLKGVANSSPNVNPNPNLQQQPHPNHNAGRRGRRCRRGNRGRGRRAFQDVSIVESKLEAVNISV